MPRRFGGTSPGDRHEHARILLALLIGSIVGGGLAVAASQRRDTQVDDATRQALQRVKAAIVEGHRTRDRAALDALYADDFTATDARGDLRTKADLLRALATDHAMAEGRYELGTIRVWGPIAVAAGHGRMVFRNADGTLGTGVIWSQVSAITLMAPAAVAGGVLRRRTMTAARTTLGVRPGADS